MSFGRDIRKLLFGLGVAVVIAAWGSVAIAFFTEAPKAVFIALTVAAAVASEGIFWLGVILLGWSVVDRRKALWRWVTGHGTAGEKTE